MKTQDQCVYIVEDDDAVRDSLGLLLGLKGYRTLPFASADDFLAACASDRVLSITWKNRSIRRPC